jgi:hypothetical protein
MSLILATIVAVMTTTVLLILGVMLVMIAQRNPASAAQLREAQGSVDYIKRGQMKAPDSLPRHWVGGGLAWNNSTQKHERQSAISLEALKSVFIAK